MVRFAPLLIALLTLAVLVGCGPKSSPPIPLGHQVQGKAYAPDGSPLTGGLLEFYPEPPATLKHTAEIQSDGSFTVSNVGNSTMLPGKYKVYMAPRPNDQKFLAKIPRKYQDADNKQSDIEVDIQGDSTNLEIRFRN